MVANTSVSYYAQKPRQYLRNKSYHDDLVSIVHIPPSSSDSAQWNAANAQRPRNTHDNRHLFKAIARNTVLRPDSNNTIKTLAKENNYYGSEQCLRTWVKLGSRVYFWYECFVWLQLLQIYKARRDQWCGSECMQCRQGSRESGVAELVALYIYRYGLAL